MSSLLLRKTGPINARIAIPGSKSYSNRALIAAVLSKGTTTLLHVSPSDDTNTLIAALKEFGASIKERDGTLQVDGWGNSLPSVKAHINVGPAGTTARFLTGLASVLPSSDIVIEGNAHMNTRPIGPLVDALRLLGADITYLQKEGSTPIRIVTTQPKQIDTIELDGSLSSQYFSSLMLVAPALEKQLRIQPLGPLVSASYVAMTADTLRAFGAKVFQDGTMYSVHGPYGSNIDYQVEADASGAMNILGLAAASGGQAVITNLPKSTQQGDVHMIEVFEQMGCSDISDDSAVGIKAERLSGTRYDMSLLPDSAMAASVVAAFADESTTLSGLSTLKHKETDRLNATVNELAKLGAHFDIDHDEALTVHPIVQLPKEPPVIETYDDHRIAMAFAIAAGKTDVIIKNPEVVTKSFPTFWDVLRECGVDMEEIK